MSNLRKLLFPIAVKYGIIIRIRNWMFDANILKSKSYDIPIICVGNLSVGGTGKTPMIEYLLDLLADKHKVATLSRGYGRNTKGFILLNGDENAIEVGDEPLQFKTKYRDVLVAVDEDRQHGIEILKNNSQAEVILLDDAFQHRKVKAGLNIVLTKYDHLYADDLMLPAGDLREPKSGVERAQIVVVTKCPRDLNSQSREKIRKKLNLEGSQKLFFSYIDYSDKIFSETTVSSISYLKDKKLTLVTGIANPKPLLRYLDDLNLKYEHLKFPDHHNFTRAEIDKIASSACILTTEKDYMRLKNEVKNEELFYLPIKMKLIENSSIFDEIVESFVQ